MFNFLRSLFPPKQTQDQAQQVQPADAEWLVVGLGNPGAQYAANRHNVGYMVLDELGDVDGVALLKPGTYMNTSGEAVAPLADRLGIPPERVIVIHDELDLPAGKVRVKLGGNENGHNGLKSITEHLGTRDYLRVRVGIGRPPQGTAVTDWVLGDIGEEHPDLDAQLALAAEAVGLIVSDGLEKAQNSIHAKS